MSRRTPQDSMLSRHLRVLDAFGVGAAFLSLSEISARTGLPVSTTHRLLRELEQQRLVERLPDRTYQLGLRLWELAARTPGALGLRSIAFPFMQAVQASLRQHTQLGVRDGSDVVYLERLSSHDAVINATVIGGRISLAASAIGHVLLADMPDDDVHRLVEQGMPRYTELTPQTSEEVAAVVKAARRNQYSQGVGLVHADATGVAVPVHGPDGEVVAGLGVVVPNGSVSLDHLLTVLRRAAAGIDTAVRRAYVAPGHPHALPGARYRPLISSSVSSMEYFDERAPR